ncbi:hypothetical protein SDC9_111016 [bioreactor metagenome]|uniref:Uncharacterized protein n=1 Tax=bioreactor metagenome TaxID=1076179 RepID=A0A645BFA1_9ZZZZ
MADFLQKPDIGIVQHIGRHAVQRAPYGAQQQTEIQRCLVVALCKVRQRGIDVPGPDHSLLACIADAGVNIQPGQCSTDFPGQLPIGSQLVQLLEQLQRRHGSPAGQGVAGIGMRMQKAARGIVVIEGRIDLIGGQHGRQGQRAAGQTFGQADEVRPDAGLLVGKQASGTAKAHGDLVHHQMH